MELKELEFLRDFSDKLDLFCLNLGDLCEATDHIPDEVDSEPLCCRILYLALWTLKHQMDLVEENFDRFRKECNEKYSYEWDEVKRKIRQEEKELLENDDDEDF